MYPHARVRPDVGRAHVRRLVELAIEKSSTSAEKLFCMVKSYEYRYRARDNKPSQMQLRAAAELKLKPHVMDAESKHKGPASRWQECAARARNIMTACDKLSHINHASRAPFKRPSPVLEH